MLVELRQGKQKPLNQSLQLVNAKDANNDLFDEWGRIINMNHDHSFKDQIERNSLNDENWPTKPVKKTPTFDDPKQVGTTDKEQSRKQESAPTAINSTREHATEDRVDEMFVKIEVIPDHSNNLEPKKKNEKTTAAKNEETPGFQSVKRKVDLKKQKITSKIKPNLDKETREMEDPKNGDKDTDLKESVGKSTGEDFFKDKVKPKTKNYQVHEETAMYTQVGDDEYSEILKDYKPRNVMVNLDELHKITKEDSKSSWFNTTKKDSVHNRKDSIVEPSDVFGATQNKQLEIFEKTVILLCIQLVSNNRHSFQKLQDEFKSFVNLYDKKQVKLSPKQERYIQSVIDMFTSKSFEQLYHERPGDTLQQLINITFWRCLKPELRHHMSHFFKFSKDKQTNLTVTLEHVEMLVQTSNYNLMRTLLQNHVYFLSPKLTEKKHQAVQTILASTNQDGLRQIQKKGSEFNNIERHLRVSDFIEFIFISHYFAIAQNQVSLPIPMLQQVGKILVALQDQANYGEIVKLMLIHDGYKLLLYLIQSKENHLSLKDKEDSERQQDVNKFKHTYLLNENKKKLIRELIETSLHMKLYYITFNALFQFKTDIEDLKLTNHIAILFDHLKRDSSFLEIKLVMLHQVFDQLNMSHARAFLQIARILITSGPVKHFLKVNINPIRVGLLLIKTIDMFHRRFTYSSNLVKEMMLKIEQQIVQVMKQYTDATELVSLLEPDDMLGNNCIDYIMKFKLTHILNTEMFDQYVESKYQGKVFSNGSLLNFSGPWQLLTNFKPWIRQRVNCCTCYIDFIKQVLWNSNERNKTIGIEYFVWQRSINLRLTLEVMFVFLLTAVFQYSIQVMISIVSEMIHKIVDLQMYASNMESAEFKIRQASIQTQMENQFVFWHCMIAVCISVFSSLVPFQFFINKYFLHKTKRRSALCKCEDILGVALFLITIAIAVYVYICLSKLKNNYLFIFFDGSLTWEKKFMLNTIWLIKEDIFRFDWLLSFQVMLVWMRLLSYFKFIRIFGVIFKVIQLMIVTFLKFLFLWGIILVMFSCVAVLLFNEISSFRQVQLNMIYFSQVVISQWDLEIFKAKSEYSDDLIQNLNLYKMGVAYVIFYFLINVVLMINFVMALLSQIFSKYQEMQTGLYNFIMMEEMPLLEWDENYGALISTRSTLATYVFVVLSMPFNLINCILPQSSLNSMLAFVQYLPLAILVIVQFAIFNTLMVPFGLISGWLEMLFYVCLGDDFALLRLWNFIMYTAFAPIIIVLCIPLNFVSLLTKLLSEEHMSAKHYENPKQDYKVTPNSFKIMMASIKELHHTLQRESSDKKTASSSRAVSFVRLNKIIQRRIGVISSVFNFMYFPLKWERNKETGKLKIKSEQFYTIKEFNIIKQFVFNCTNQYDNNVSLELVENLVEQMQQKQKMYEMLLLIEHLQDIRNPAQIYEDNVYELFVHRAHPIEKTLHDGQYLFEATDQKFNLFVQRVENLQSNQGAIFNELMTIQSVLLSQQNDSDKIASMILSLHKQEAYNFNALHSEIPKQINMKLSNQLNSQFGEVANTHNDFDEQLQQIKATQKTVQVQLEALANALGNLKLQAEDDKNSTVQQNFMPKKIEEDGPVKQVEFEDPPDTPKAQKKEQDHLIAFDKELPKFTPTKSVLRIEDLYNVKPQQRLDYATYYDFYNNEFQNKWGQYKIQVGKMFSDEKTQVQKEDLQKEQEINKQLSIKRAQMLRNKDRDEKLQVQEEPSTFYW